jgi:hypothetical protein
MAQPLDEVLGFPITNRSVEADALRANSRCRFKEHKQHRCKSSLAA